LSKAFGTANLTSGSSTTLILTLTNPASNPAALTGVQVDDTFPAGLTLQNIVFTYTPAACGTVSKTTGAASAAGDNNIRFALASLALGASCQFSVNVTSTTVGIITNTTNTPIATGPATLTGIMASANLTISNLPNITLLKTVAIYSDPVNGTTNPKYIPGAVAQYAIIASNSGSSADNNSTFITDPVPANTALYVNNVGGTPAGPVSFTNGATPSGLTLVATNISFSNSGSAGPWTYTPVPGADGCDPAVTHLRVNPQGTFLGSPTAPNPSFQLTFRVCVK